MKAKATKRTMARATMVASKDEGNGNGNQGGKQATAMRVIVAVITVVEKDEGGGDGDAGGGQCRG